MIGINMPFVIYNTGIAGKRSTIAANLHESQATGTVGEKGLANARVSGIMTIMTGCTLLSQDSTLFYGYLFFLPLRRRRMSEQTDATPREIPPSLVSTAAPYEDALIKAFDRLTSEIFIFLLAYFILIVGLSFLNVRLTDTLRNLLYIIPILGVVAYLWVRQHELVRDAKKHGVDVKEGVRVDAGNVSDDAVITGVSGAGEGPIGNVDVAVRRASNRAIITGIDYAQADAHSPSEEERYLVKLFRQLDVTSRDRLIAQAQKLRKKQNPADD
jgi:hypothetical protein